MTMVEHNTAIAPFNSASIVIAVECSDDEAAAKENAKSVAQPKPPKLALQLSPRKELRSLVSDFLTKPSPTASEDNNGGV